MVTGSLDLCDSALHRLLNTWIKANRDSVVKRQFWADCQANSNRLRDDACLAVLRREEEQHASKLGCFGVLCSTLPPIIRFALGEEHESIHTLTDNQSWEIEIDGKIVGTTVQRIPRYVLPHPALKSGALLWAAYRILFEVSQMPGQDGWLDKWSEDVLAIHWLLRWSDSDASLLNLECPYAPEGTDDYPFQTDARCWAAHFLYGHPVIKQLWLRCVERAVAYVGIDVTADPEDDQKTFKPPLNDNERLIRDELRRSRDNDNNGMTAKELVLALRDRWYTCESTLTKHFLGRKSKLRTHYGVENTRGVGYFLKEGF